MKTSNSNLSQKFQILKSNMNEHDNNIDPNIAYSSNTNQNYDDKYYERYLQQLSESDPIAFQNFISNFSSASNKNIKP